VKDNTQKLEIKYTYIAAWAGNAELYSVIRCDNETYERQIVASFDELSKEENAELSQKCVDALNFTTDHDIMRAQLKAAEDKLANIGQYIDAYQVASIRVPSYWLKKIKQALTT